LVVKVKIISLIGMDVNDLDNPNVLLASVHIILVLYIWGTTNTVRSGPTERVSQYVF
jgi:hypothetical protein